MSKLPEWLMGPDFSEEVLPTPPKEANPLEIYNSNSQSKRKRRGVDEQKVIEANNETAMAVELGETVIGGSK